MSGDRDDGFVAADVAEAEAEGGGGEGEGAVPEGVGFGAVEDDTAEFVEAEVAVGMEGAGGGGAVGGDGFEGFEVNKFFWISTYIFCSFNCLSSKSS